MSSAISLSILLGNQHAAFAPIALSTCTPIATARSILSYITNNLPPYTPLFTSLYIPLANYFLSWVSPLPHHVFP